jgi:hypothetical protein
VTRARTENPFETFQKYMIYCVHGKDWNFDKLERAESACYISLRHCLLLTENNVGSVML